MSKQKTETVRFTLTTPPHSDKQRLLMNAFFIPGLLELWCACGTKFGKTYGIAGGTAVAAPLNKQQLFRWIAPVYTQARIGYKYLKRMLPGEPYVRASDSGPTIYFPSVDNTIQFFHGQKPESIEGEAVDGNILDEAAKLKEGVYESVKTTTTYTGGPIIGVSTPLGKNWFYRKCMEAKEEMVRAKREGRRPTKIFIHAPTWTNPGVNQRVIEDARKTLPKRIFSQLYEAAFLDDGSVFLYLLDAFGNPSAWPDLQTYFAPSQHSKRIFVGADWAKTRDYTVFYALNERGKCLGYKRFNRIRYTEQVKSLRAFCDELVKRSDAKDCYLSVLHDKTGVGEAIDDIIQTSEFPYDCVGITWNNTNKEAAVNDLILSFEEQCLDLYPWETARKELGNFECTTTKSGRPTFAAVEGEHDDTVMAIITANMQFREARGDDYALGTIDSIHQLISKYRLDEKGKLITEEEYDGSKTLTND